MDVLARDVPVDDVPRLDVIARDVPPVDVPPADVPPADLGVVDAPTSACVARAPLPDPVCMGVCGNNHVDTCSVCMPCGPRPPLGGPDAGPPPPFDAGTCCTPVTEACDGNDLAGSTCASLGFTGGTLRCGGACGFDTSDCDDCAQGSAIVACGRARVTAHAPSRIALATSATEVGLAWVTDNAGGGGDVGFARYSPTLSLVRELPCVTTGARRVALSRSGDGWLLAVETRAGIELRALTSDGDPRGAVRMVGGSGAPSLAPAPDGRTLLVYTASDGVRAGVRSVVLSPLGEPVSGEAQLLTEVTEPEYGNAVWAGTRWVVAMRERGVALVPVSADGVAGAVVHPLTTDTEYPQVGWNGAAVTLTWSDFGSGNGVRYAPLEPGLTLRGSPVTLGMIPTWYNYTPTVSVGGDTVALMSGYTGGTGLSRNLAVLRIGASPGAPATLTHSPDTEAEHRVAVMGADVIVAWVANNNIPGRITLARAHP